MDFNEETTEPSRAWQCRLFLPLISHTSPWQPTSCLLLWCGYNAWALSLSRFSIFQAFCIVLCLTHEGLGISSNYFPYVQKRKKISTVLTKLNNNRAYGNLHTYNGFCRGSFVGISSSL
jgi:hypothetical protein